MNCPACGAENMEGIDRCENCLAPFRDLDVPRADAAEGLARSVMEDTLSQLEFDEIIRVSPETPVIEVARRMKEARSGCALVLEGHKLVGIFTEHDVLLMTDHISRPDISHTASGTGESSVDDDEIRVTDIPFGDAPIEEIRAEQMLSADKANTREENRQGFSSNLTVGELMSRDPETLNEDDSVAAALNKMSLGRYRHIPVKRNDRSYAVASIQSVLKYIAQEDW